MPPAARIPASPIHGISFARPTCTPHCALVPDPHLRSKSGRSVAPGDIHVTRTSLVAPFHKAIDIASLQSKENKAPQHASTSDSQSTIASSIRASQRSTLLSASCASTSKGGKRRPCIVIQMQRSSARVFLMGTFGGSRTQDLPQELRPYLAIMSSCNCKWKGNRLEKWRNGHAHSIPEWYQEDGNIQYIVPIVHEIGMDAVEERWADRTPSRGNNAEGYHMDMTNMNLRMGRDLKMRCVSREYRKRLRRAARKPVDSQQPTRHRSTRSVSSVACQSTLSSISESGTFSSATETIASAGRGATDSSSWRSGMSSADISKSHERSSILDSRNMAKAGKLDLETSSTRSARSFISRPLFSSPLAKHSQSSVASRQP
ncbi:hypothetical protein FB107DRAFT_254125 [Schizophyllum commune]